jgi:hypothetical protein
MIDLPDLSLYSVCAFGISGLAIGLLGLLACRLDARRGGSALTPVLLGVGGLGACSALLGRPPGLGWPLLTLTSLLLLFRVVRSERLAGVLATMVARVRTPRWQWVALALGCPIAAATLLAFGTGRQPIEAPPAPQMPPGTAVTDRGRDVPLWQARGGPWPVQVMRAAEVRELRGFALDGRLIQVGPPDWSYNCHGWVFTGGCYLLPDDYVETVLQDNGYGPVEGPDVGDLTIYRNDQGSVIHTALVWAVGDDGRVLVESKWDWKSRYLHPPDGTPYGERWAYYRSPRPGHLLRGLDSLSPGASPSPSSRAPAPSHP